MRANQPDIHCVKLKKDLPGLSEPPFPTELGALIYEKVSKEAWDLAQRECALHQHLSRGLGEQREH
ncbi:MAG: Fe(2+)-trafficking protein [Myxococcales bacterium]|nr:Fe(2+)-trafficking protein [Myxococcales bacterium]